MVLALASACSDFKFLEKVGFLKTSLTAVIQHGPCFHHIASLFESHFYWYHNRIFQVGLTHVLLIWLTYNEVQFTPVLLLFSSLISLKLFSGLFLSFFFISKPFSNVACFPSQVLLFLVLLQNFEWTPSLSCLQHP